MKMINSTSTTSTSGVMLISDCRLEPEPVSTCMTLVSSRLGCGAIGDQPYPAETGLLDRDHHLLDRVKIELCVSTDHNLGVLFAANCSTQGIAEILRRYRHIVDPQVAVLVNGDKGLSSFVALRDRLRRVRQVNLRSPLHLRRHHHEDDQQHEHDVD